jgi:serine palmitoyltransferase
MLPRCAALCGRCVCRYRLCVEESYALGVLGATGRGACEAAGLQPGQVDVLVASMGTSMASVGGFCVGHHEVRGSRLHLET